MSRYGMVIDLTICAGCSACVMACKQINATPQGIYWCNLDVWEEGKYPDAVKKVLPHACMQCREAPCVANCPSGASHYSEENLVLVDQEVCIGCQTCVKVCPYDARHYNGEGTGAPYYGVEFGTTVYEDLKTSKHELGKVGKCTYCVERLREGKEPICVKTCITKCRVFGDIDDPESEISKLIAEKGAKQMRAEVGTNPTVYFIGEY